MGVKVSAAKDLKYKKLINYLFFEIYLNWRCQHEKNQIVKRKSMHKNVHLAFGMHWCLQDPMEIDHQNHHGNAKNEGDEERTSPFCNFIGMAQSFQPIIVGSQFGTVAKRL